VTTTAEEDFREFVVARWGELEPVALLVTLDPAVARRVTTEALAGLHARWRELLDDGMPGATARGALLTAALAAATRPGRAFPAAAATTGTVTSTVDPEPEVTALVAAVRDATPLERAVLAASSTWGLDADDVAPLAGMPAAPVRAAEVTVRRSLLAAHTGARAREGREPAEWALDRDLAEALDLLLSATTDPPDAAALVGERRRRVRRRTVVLGTGGALAAAAAGAFVLEAVAAGAASEAAPLPPGPGDPVWITARSWPARGALATDGQVAALVDSASPRARLLFADDVAGRRVVVAAAAGTSGTSGTVVRLWAGPRGAAPRTLTAVDLVRDRVAFLDDVVPLAVDAGPDDEGGAVLLLARPTVLEAQYSPLVRYSPTGDVGRRWSVRRLDDGVAVLALGGPLPPAFRVRLDGYDGAPLGATPLGLPSPARSAPLAQGLLDALGPFVAACTGLPLSAVRSTVAHEVEVGGEVLVPAGPGAPPGRGHVVVALTHLPDGAVLRSVRVAGGGRDEVAPVDVETTRVIAPEAAGDPVVARLPSFSDLVGRFLVLAPGAARAQLVVATTDTYPASEVTALREGSAVLEVADARRAPAYRLVTWDASGRRLGAWEQVFRRRDPRDLWPRVR
jgi:hypothetical protein